MLCVDWLSAEVPCRHPEPLWGDRVICLSPDGEMRWEVHKRIEVEGSHSSKVMVKSIPSRIPGTTDYSGFWVSGNPIKWFQGHNLFGSDDVQGLLLSLIEAIVARLSLTPQDSDQSLWYSGAIKLTRVDLTCMYATGSRSNARAWIRAASSQASMAHRGRSVMTGETLYFGKNSRRSSLKIYSKGEEITVSGHEIPASVSHRNDLVSWADDKLRIELVLRGMELKRLGLLQSGAWGVTLSPWKLFRSYMEKLTLSDQFRLPLDVLETLPARLRTVYSAWKAGEDLRAMLPRRTFYRYRSELLPHGIDIAVQQGPDRSNVVPLVRVIEAVPAQVPDWARGTPLYFEPRPRVA